MTGGDPRFEKIVADLAPKDRKGELFPDLGDRIVGTAGVSRVTPVRSKTRRGELGLWRLAKTISFRFNVSTFQGGGSPKWALVANRDQLAC
jgi:hypothetical protein